MEILVPTWKLSRPLDILNSNVSYIRIYATFCFFLECLVYAYISKTIQVFLEFFRPELYDFSEFSFRNIIFSKQIIKLYLLLDLGLRFDFLCFPLWQVFVWIFILFWRNVIITTFCDRQMISMYYDFVRDYHNGLNLTRRRYFLHRVTRRWLEAF